MSQTFPPVRLAALDLDGTLLNHEGQVTPRTRAALQAASDRGDCTIGAKIIKILIHD